MKKMTISKTIDINAPKEIVWEVLLNDKFTSAWYSEFSPGTHADTDWKLGSKAIFTDNSHSGLIGKIIANNAYEHLSVEYQGIVIDGAEDYTSSEATFVKGGLETYRLAEKNGRTTLSIDCDMGEDMFQSMSEAWERALAQIKRLSESAFEEQRLISS